MLTTWGMWMRAAGAPETTIGLRLYHLRRFLSENDCCDPFALETEQLVLWIAEHDWKPNTRRAYRSSLRAFYTWAQATGRRTDNPALGIPPVRIPRALPRPTPEQVYVDAVTGADERVRLMIELAAICGLRRGEISRVRREDVEHDLDGGRVLFVRGKGAHERVVPLPAALAADILERPPGWVFPSSAPGGGPLTPHHVGKLVSAAFPGDYTCHNLRHRCGTIALEVTNDIRAVQELLGHAKLETVQIYTLVTRGRIRAAIDATARDPRLRGDAA